MMLSKFFVILREDGGCTNKRHLTKDAAIKDACSMAKSEGCKYFVLESIGATKKLDVGLEEI